MRFVPFACLLFSVMLASQALGAASEGQPASALRVMSFNVRYPNPEDGPNRWSLRAPLFIETIRRAQPDLIGTQEIFAKQAHDLVKALPRYLWFGVDRFGGHRDEHMGIFYRTDRLKVIRHGTFWLSQHPEQPGSMSWGEALPRYVNWAIFATRTRHPYRFLMLDTHLANRDDEDRTARYESATLIARRLPQLADKLPIILTADLNSDAADQPHRILTSILTDSWETAEQRHGPTGTFHDFTGQPRARIDVIMSRGFLTRAITVDDFHRGAHYPSDHFPIEALLQPLGH